MGDLLQIPKLPTKSIENSQIIFMEKELSTNTSKPLPKRFAAEARLVKEKS